MHKVDFRKHKLVFLCYRLYVTWNQICNHFQIEILIQVKKHAHSIIYLLKSEYQIISAFILLKVAMSFFNSAYQARKRNHCNIFLSNVQNRMLRLYKKHWYYCIFFAFALNTNIATFKQLDMSQHKDRYPGVQPVCCGPSHEFVNEHVWLLKFSDQTKWQTFSSL